MNNLLYKIKFWYKNSRPYTIPITLLSWLVIFIYSLKQGGSAVLGVISYFGIALVHLATNLSDDYFDFIRLAKDGKFSSNEKSIKCKYLVDGSATIQDLRNVIIIILTVAGIIGGILFFASGWKVLLFALATLPIAVLYSKLSSKGLGDAAVILAYGPLMFEGVYYVMTGKLSTEVLVLSFACAMFVNTILYTHMLMDYDGDVKSGKTTLCTRLKTKDNALKGLMWFYIAGYVFTLIFCFMYNKLFLITFLTLPQVYELYNSLKKYNQNKHDIPKARFWHQPLDNWKTVSKCENAAFFFRFFYARNISTYFMLLSCIALIFK